ncbi:hypothetical protein HGP14_34665 [Rhizobium sp. P32RR-XVIII]|uniref:MFS transporter n=1 Tax=Rhizobium sp. P32RR-XVIII TaxID=2726738 RepID=UPI001457372B|nr:MFS transporter [Rhizobium sp. P32RR-XVIII]NLS08326.1 hypothetical protein [Rhizobium sp. P32RR-XVIII]
MTADLILHHGLITTLDRSNPAASAVAIKDGKFLAVGRDEDVMALASPQTKVIDLMGKRALPGLIVEWFMVESWAEHLRQHRRVSRADADLQTEALKYRIGPDGPVVRHFLSIDARRDRKLEDGLNEQ